MSKTVVVKGKEEEDSILFKLREDDKVIYKRLPFNNYFYILEEDYKIIEFQLRNFIKDTEIISANNGIYRKLIFKNNFSRNNVRDIIEENSLKTFEADMTSVKRFLINEHKLPLNQDGLKCCYIDIETDDRQPLNKAFNEVVSGDSAITSCAFKDAKTGEVKFIYNKAREYITLEEAEKNPAKFTELLLQHEKKFLLEFRKIAKDYDVLFAWNGRHFDFPFLQDRFTLHGLNYYDMFVNDIDYKLVYFQFTWGNFKKTNLNFIAKKELETEIDNKDTKFKNLDEIQKIDWKEKTRLKKFYQLYLKEFKIFKEYNIQDVNLMYMLEQKLNYFHLCSVLSKETHTFLQDAIYNSRTFDNAMCIEYKKRNYIAPSKPNDDEYSKRLTEKIGGGYTYVYKKGLHKNLFIWDFKSFYPTTDATYNISPETYVKDIQPKLDYVFNEKEIEYIYYCKNVVAKFKDSKGGLNKKKYEKAIEEKRIELNVDNMEILMFKFVEEYDKNLENFTEYLKKNDYVATPADINYDTYGWDIHPHRIFKNNVEGCFPHLSKRFILRRDDAKYKLKILPYHSNEWYETEYFQVGLKTLGNSGYGTFLFKNFRFYMKEVGDSITSACRYTMKKSILFARKQNCEIILGDTDSSFLLLPEKETKESMDLKYYNYYDEMVKPFNTLVSIPLENPETKEKVNKNHFIVFEYEKKFESCIAVAKKRYYYKQIIDGEPVYLTQGGYFKKSDSMKLAADIQYDLCKDILDFNFDKELWKKKILDLKEKVYSYNLEVEHIVATKSLSKNIDEYGKPMIDKNTGKQKVTAAGKLRFATVPAHVILAKRLKEAGQEIQVGDKIEYVVLKSCPIEAISVEEFLERKEYDAKYYWERVSSPLIEILSVVYPDDVFTTFKDCWLYTPKQLERLIEKLDEE